MVAEDAGRLQGTEHIDLKGVGVVEVQTEHLGSLGHRSSDRPWALYTETSSRLVEVHAGLAARQGHRAAEARIHQALGSYSMAYMLVRLDLTTKVVYTPAVVHLGT
jgi:hypothetical protein